MPVILKNNVSSTLATAITASDTAIVVADGSKFPALSAGEYFYATLVSPAGTTEIVKVTARVSNSLTVVRAQDGSSAASFQVGALVEMRANAASIAEISDEASEVSIADTGGYYAATDVEGALQEIGGIRNPKDVATLLADTALAYTNAPAGTIVRTRAEGFSYQVAASGASDQHVTTAGGVKLYVLPDSGGEVNVRAFGSVGDGVADDTVAFQRALATQRDVFVPNGTYLLTDTLTVSQQRLRGQNGNRTTLRFNHTNGGFAVRVWTNQRGGGIDNLTLDAVVDGLKGLNMFGTVIAKCDQVFINNFTQISLQLGDTPSAGGIYWSKIGLVRIRLDNDKNGDTGVLIDGGAIPGSNANSLEDVVIGGNFKRPLHIKGVGNYVKSGTIELIRGTENVVSMIYIEGSGNKIDGMYVEPLAGPPPATLVEFGPNASGNIIEIWPQYVPSHNVSASIVDNGAHNKVLLRRPGANFKIGPEAEPAPNLLMNSSFRAWRDAENPVGWLFGTAGRISRVAPEAVGGPSILRMTLTANAASIQTYLTDYFTPTSGVVPVDLERLRGKPVVAGVWCRTTVAGAGGVKFNRGVGGVAGIGNDRHSGSGDWELLLAHGNVTEAHDRVGMELRSENTNQPITGTVDFRDPFFVLGTDVPYFSPKPLTDTGAKVFGDLEFPFDYTDKARGGVLRLGTWYVWADTSGKLRIGSTRPTDATWDSAGTVVGTQT